MQTDIRSLDFMFRGAGAKGLKNIDWISGRDQLAAENAQTDFARIMQGLLGLQKTKMGLADETMDSAGDMAITAAEFFDSIKLDEDAETQASEMIEMLWALNQAVDLPSQQQTPGEDGDLFMDLARMLVNADSQSSETSADIKDRWSQIMEQLKAGPTKGENLPTQASDTACDKSAVENKNGEQRDSLSQAMAQKQTDTEAVGAGSKKTPAVQDNSMFPPETSTGQATGKSPSPIAAAHNENAKEGQTAEKDPNEKYAIRVDRLSNAPHAGEPAVKGDMDGRTSSDPKDSGATRENKTFIENLNASAQTADGAESFQSTGDDDRSDDNPTVQRTAAGSEAHHNTTVSRLNTKTDAVSPAADSARAASLPDKEGQTDVIRQIVQRMSMHTTGGQSKMVIQLKPEFLGNVHMQVLTEHQQITVRMTAESSAVKEIVEQNIHFLRQELQHHGLEIQKFDVFVANDNQGSKSGQNMAGFGQTLRHRQQNTNGGKIDRGKETPLSAVETERRISTQENGEINYFA